MSMKKEVGEGIGDTFNNIKATSNINVSNIETYNFHDFPEYFQYLAEAKAITILPLKPGTKEPKLRN